MAVTIDGSGEITGLDEINNIALPTTGFGKVLQVLTYEYATQTNTTSTSFVTTNLAGAITPSLSTSKILVIANTAASNTSTTEASRFTLFRGTVAGTNLSAQGFAYIFSLGGRVDSNVTCISLDSPSTTSATTYTLAMRTDNASTTVTSNIANMTSTLLLMEIAA